MDGIVVTKNGSYAKEGTTFLKGNRSDLIVREGNVEITLDTMPRGTVGFFYMPEGGHAVEFNYVLTGKMEILGKDETITVSQGDIYCLKDMKTNIMFEVLEDMKILYFNTGGFYNGFEQRVAVLTRVLNQVQEQDGDTLEHCERVKVLCLGIAYHLHYDTDKLRELFYAARFHDVGKAKIPLEILLKPGKLTEEEYTIMKCHSLYTYEMLRAHYGEEIANIAYEHHERLDGKGYPRRLKAEEISLPARIICAADAYDAMVTSRPYHVGMPQKEAMEELWRGVDTQFDHDVVQALEQYLHTRGETESFHP